MAHADLKTGTHQITIHTNGGGIHGDITVHGFSSAPGARQIAAIFVDALRSNYPDSDITAEITATP